MPFIPLFQSPKSFYRLAVASFFFLQGLVFASWASRIPDIKQALDLNEAQLGGVLFAIPVGQMSAMALSGYLVSRFGSHRMLLLAALLYSGTLMALGFISETWHLFAMLVFFGVAANLHNISVNTQAVGVERLYRRSIMAAFHGLWSLAGFVGGIVGALFAAFSVSTRVHFSFIFAVCMGIVAIMFRLTLPRDRARDTAPGHKRPKGKIDPYVVLLGLIAFGCMASEGTMYDWSAVYYEAIIKPSPELIRLGYIAYMCTMVCGRFMADGLVTRFGVIRILQASGALIAAGLLISVLLPHVATATFGLALVGFGTASVVPVCYSMAGKSQIMHPSVALAVVSTIGFLGFLLCPPVIGFIAHVDTSPDMSGKEVKPRVIEEYDGGDIALNENTVLSPEDFPILSRSIGKHLIVTDGTTLLGADDKAGVAEIMAAVELLQGRPHGEVRVVFTTDEEIGCGVDGLNVAELACDYGYTVDGGPLGEIEYENFNAASGDVTFRGVGVHPGSAKNVMVNAATVAMAFHAMLPADEVPEKTDGYEGFFHLTEMSGSVTEATLRYIIRDHDRERFEEKKALFADCAARLDEIYGDGTAEAQINDSYYNMKEKILPHFHLIERAENAFRANGVEPQCVPIRGGTDGARLSWDGLPCPNLSTGGYNYHGVREWIPADSLEAMTNVLVTLTESFAE